MPPYDIDFQSYSPGSSEHSAAYAKCQASKKARSVYASMGKQEAESHTRGDAGGCEDSASKFSAANAAAGPITRPAQLIPKLLVQHDTPAFALQPHLYPTSHKFCQADELRCEADRPNANVKTKRVPAAEEAQQIEADNHPPRQGQEPSLEHCNEMSLMACQLQGFGPPPPPPAPHNSDACCHLSQAKDAQLPLSGQTAAHACETCDAMPSDQHLSRVPTAQIGLKPWMHSTSTKGLLYGQHEG